jgi:hypothetical protein
MDFFLGGTRAFFLSPPLLLPLLLRARGRFAIGLGPEPADVGCDFDLTKGTAAGAAAGGWPSARLGVAAT